MGINIEEKELALAVEAVASAIANTQANHNYWGRTID